MSAIKYKRIFNGPSGGGSGGTNITAVVANYSALPAVGVATGNFYWVSASQGTAWLPGSLGGTYYPKGLYYSNGVTWEYTETPAQATQSEVNTGTNTDKFVTPSTLSNWTGLGNYVPYTGATGNVTLGTYNLTTPKVIGGTGVTSKVTLVASTNAAPTSTAVAFELFCGTNGTQYNPYIVKHDGKTVMGTGVSSLESVHIFGGTNSTSGLKLGSYNSAWGGFWSGAVTPATNNYALIARDTRTAINAVTDIYFYIGDAVATMAVSSGVVCIGNAGSMHIGSAALDIRKATEQLRVGYDSSFYFNATTSSTGLTTFNTGASGTQSFAFAKGISLPYVAKTANYTTTLSDYTIDCTSGTFTVTLLTAVGNSGKIYNIKNSGTGDITIATTSSQTIDGQASGYWIISGSSYANKQLQSNGANWIFI